MKIRSYIVGSLWTGAFLLVVLIVAGVLWGLLSALEDSAGASGALGVACVALVCWLLNFVVLVVLLAWAVLEYTKPGLPEDES